LKSFSVSANERASPEKSMKLLIVSLAAVLLLLNCKKSILVAEPKTETFFNKRLVPITTNNVQNSNLLYNE
jgi:hypothetical protein